MKTVRIIAILVGLGTIAWQIMQWSGGNAQNMFFLPDILVGLYLAAAALFRDVRRAMLHMFAGFGLMSGIYLVVTLGTPWVEETFSVAANSTLLGLIFTLPCMVWLGRRLTVA